MVDNITLKCCDKEVYHHLCYGTFVEESNWISGKPYDRLLLNNGKSGTDRENLKIEFERDSMTISGSIRKWYYGASSLDDLTKTDLEKAWRKVAAWLGISFDTLRTFEISEIEIGLNVPINMTCTEMVHRIWGFTSKRYKLKESSSECREFVLACHTVKICNGIDEINGNVLIRRNILRVAFLSGDERRSVLDRLKAGTLGELFDGYYIRAVNYFWRSCREFLFDTLGRRPSFRLKRGNLKELTDFILMLGLASLSHTELEGYAGLLSKEAQRDFRKWLRIHYEREKEYSCPDYQFEFYEAVKWRLIELIRKNNLQTSD